MILELRARVTAKSRSAINNVLNHQQLNEFKQNGILRVSSAIPAAHIEAMTMQVWDNLERRYPFRRNRPDTQTAQRANELNALDKSITFEKIGSIKVCQMLDELLGSAN